MGWIKLWWEQFRRWFAFQETRRPRYATPGEWFSQHALPHTAKPSKPYLPKAFPYTEAGMEKLISAVEAEPPPGTAAVTKLVIEPKVETFFDHVAKAQAECLAAEIRVLQSWWHCGHLERERCAAGRAGRN